MKKENIKYILYIGGVIAALSIPLAAMPVRATTTPIGNETLPAWPLSSNETLAAATANGGLLQAMGDYFESHFAFRPELITTDSVLRHLLFGESTQDSVISGTDNWLYYEATLDDYQRADLVSDRTLFNEANNVRLFQEYVENTGVTFLFTIAPNKNSLYGDHMPLRYQVAENTQSDMERLIPYLQDAGVHYVDLIHLFTSSDVQTPQGSSLGTTRDGREVLYYARDSHWNEKGAVMAYNALLDAAAVDHKDYADVTPSESTDYYGDLTKMLYPTETLFDQTDIAITPENRLTYLSEDDTTWQYVGDTKSVEENRIETTNKVGEGTLLMYRDSFGNSLLPYFAQVYEKATFSKTEPIDGTDLESVTPDLVIFEKVERHLPTLAGVPATMAAPLRSYEGFEINRTVSAGSTTLQTIPNETAIRLVGVVDPSLIKTNSRIYVEITDSDSTDLYEAFTTTQGKADTGFLAYLDPTTLSGDILDVRVLVESGKQLQTVYEERAEGYDGAVKSASLQEEETPVAEQIESLKDDLQSKPEVTNGKKNNEKAEANKKVSADEKAEADKKALQDADTTSEVKPSEKSSDEDVKKEDASTQDDGSSKKASEAEKSAAPEKNKDAKKDEAPAKTDEPAKTPEPVKEETTPAPAKEEAAAPAPAAPPARTEVSRTYYEDCGQDTGYWEIVYSDGTVEYIDG